MTRADPDVVEVLHPAIGVAEHNQPLLGAFPRLRSRPAVSTGTLGQRGAPSRQPAVHRRLLARVFPAAPATERPCFAV
jgi:hypothetical protein